MSALNDYALQVSSGIDIAQQSEIMGDVFSRACQSQPGNGNRSMATIGKDQEIAYLVAYIHRSYEDLKRSWNALYVRNHSWDFEAMAALMNQVYEGEVQLKGMIFK